MHTPELDPRDVVAAAQLGVWDFYPQTGTLVWSPRCREIFGLTPEASVDYGVFLRAVHIDDRARVSQAVQKALTAGGDPHIDLEYRGVRAADGAQRWLWALGEASFDAAGVPSRLVGVVVDITERKQRALQDRNLTLVADNSADFIAFASPEGKLLYLNPAGLALVGLDDLAEVQGHEMIDLFAPE
ncbi:MAG TPA: PAS domain-containing protein, partial [Nannocystis sp.]